MTAYIVGASGCDDSTYALVDLNDTEVITMLRVAGAINARSTYDCKPTIRVVPEMYADSYEIESATETIEESAS